jgi:glycosyltransferase involved in cell wall biosynthesis
MKITYLTADFGVPVLGTTGASAHVRGLVRALQHQGHEVDVLAANVGAGGSDDGSFPVRELPFGEALRELYGALRQEDVCQGTRLAKDLRNLLYALSLELQGRLVLERNRPDVIYERYCLFSTAGLELARHFDVPLLLEVNAPLVLEQQRVRGLSLPTVARAAERLIFTRADHVLVVSEWLREYVIAQGVGAGRVSVVPNAADPELFSPRHAGADLRRTLGWSDRFVVGFVGSMKRWHGVSTLVEALQRLGGAGGPFRLLLVGAGPEWPDLQAAIARSGIGAAVHATGAVAHERVPALIEAMDVVVAPYAPGADSYFSPVKLFEYMAMARPVVAARIGQTADVIEHGRSGWLYEPGDVTQLADAIRTLSGDASLRERLASAARQRVLVNYTWQHNARRVTELAERALSDRLARARLPPGAENANGVRASLRMEGMTWPV